MAQPTDVSLGGATNAPATIPVAAATPPPTSQSLRRQVSFMTSPRIIDPPMGTDPLFLPGKLAPPETESTSYGDFTMISRVDETDNDIPPPLTNEGWGDPETNRIWKFSNSEEDAIPPLEKAATARARDIMLQSRHPDRMLESWDRNISFTQPDIVAPGQESQSLTTADCLRTLNISPNEEIVKIWRERWLESSPLEEYERVIRIHQHYSAEFKNILWALFLQENVLSYLLERLAQFVEQGMEKYLTRQTFRHVAVLISMVQRTFASRQDTMEMLYGPVVTIISSYQHTDIDVVGLLVRLVQTGQRLKSPWVPLLLSRTSFLDYELAKVRKVSAVSTIDDCRSLAVTGYNSKLTMQELASPPFMIDLNLLARPHQPPTTTTIFPFDQEVIAIMPRYGRAGVQNTAHFGPRDGYLVRTTHGDDTSAVAPADNRGGPPADNRGGPPADNRGGPPADNRGGPPPVVTAGGLAPHPYDHYNRNFQPWCTEEEYKLSMAKSRVYWPSSGHTTGGVHCPPPYLGPAYKNPHSVSYSLPPPMSEEEEIARALELINIQERLAAEGKEPLVDMAQYNQLERIQRGAASKCGSSPIMSASWVSSNTAAAAAAYPEQRSPAPEIAQFAQSSSVSANIFAKSSNVSASTFGQSASAATPSKLALDEESIKRNLDMIKEEKERAAAYAINYDDDYDDYVDYVDDYVDDGVEEQDVDGVEEENIE